MSGIFFERADMFVYHYVSFCIQTFIAFYIMWCEEIMISKVTMACPRGAGNVNIIIMTMLFNPLSAEYIFVKNMATKGFYSIQNHHKCLG